MAAGDDSAVWPGEAVASQAGRGARDLNPGPHGPEFWVVSPTDRFRGFELIIDDPAAQSAAPPCDLHAVVSPPRCVTFAAFDSFGGTEWTLRHYRNPLEKSQTWSG